MFLSLNSLVFTVIPVIQASIPTQEGTFLSSLNTGFTLSKPFGAYGSSISLSSKIIKLVAATPHNTSALGLSFSANNLAVISPTDNLSTFNLISGYFSLNVAKYGSILSSSIAV